MTNIVMVLSFSHYDDYSIIRRLYYISGLKSACDAFQELHKDTQ